MYPFTIPLPRVLTWTKSKRRKIEAKKTAIHKSPRRSLVYQSPPLQHLCERTSYRANHVSFLPRQYHGPVEQFSAKFQSKPFSRSLFHPILWNMKVWRRFFPYTGVDVNLRASRHTPPPSAKSKPVYAYAIARSLARSHATRLSFAPYITRVRDFCINRFA